MSEARRRKTKENSNSDLLADHNDTMTNENSTPPPAALVFLCGCLFSILFVVLVVISSSLVSFALMDSFTWGYEAEDIKALPIVSKLFPPEIFTEETIAQYKGEDPLKPIYVVVRGHVFDVTKGARFYGPQGGYHIFAGRDASRSFATGCFDPRPGSECLDAAKNLGMEGLDEKETKEVNNWINFYRDNKEYSFVGYYPSSPAADEEAKKWL